MSRPREPCECEMPGAFYSGVPGILGAMENGHLAPGSVVERCDVCQRYPSDASALAKLRELGLAEVDESAAYDVHYYTVVRVEFPGIVAASQQEAADRVLDRFDWHVHGRGAQLADNPDRLVVMAETDLAGRRIALALEDEEP